MKDTAPPRDEPFEVTVFVDQSQSIRGFVPSTSPSEFFAESDFVDLLRALAHQAEVISFTGFGTGGPAGPEEEEIRTDYGRRPPLAQDGFELMNNDYAALIHEFITGKQPNRIFLMITDGVQSHPQSEEGSLMGATAEAMQAWVQAGGHLDVRILTAPFRGKYFSEELRARGETYTLNISKSNRPFLVCAFIPNGTLLDEWTAFTARERLTDLAWQESYRLPQYQETTAPDIVPHPMVLSVVESETMGLTPQINRPYMEFRHLKELDDPWSDRLWWTRIDSEALRDDNMTSIGLLPIYLDCTQYRKAENETFFTFDREAFNAWKPRLLIYRLRQTEPVDRKVNPSADQEQSLAESPPQWELIEDRDLRFVDPTVVELPQIDGSVPKGAARTHCLRFQVPWDAKAPLICILKQTTTEEALDPPKFDDWSTMDDSTSEQMNRVYNLQTLMEQVIKDGVKIGNPQGCIIFLEP